MLPHQAVPQSQNEAILLQQNNVLFQENYQRSQNEQVLFNSWKLSETEKVKAKAKADQLDLQLKELKVMYDELTLKYKELEKKYIPSTTEKKTVEYHTDEDELAYETEWIRVKQNRKKRKLNTSLTPPPKQQQNTLGAFSNGKIRKPPPIVVENIKNFNTLHKMVNELNNAIIKIVNDKTFKINVQNENDYKTLSALLNENDYSWHTYENKQNRPIKVMANKLHHSVSPDQIVQDMIKRGYKIIEATGKLKYKTKQPLNMFMLSFRHDESVDKIYEIRDILGYRVEILPLRKSKLVPQCKKCQAYGHTQKYCAMEPRCVRCTGKHLTINCDKPKTEQPRCVHCGEGHPANYRGCMVAKEMQKLKEKRTKKTTLPKQPQRNYQQIPATSINEAQKSYSQAVSDKPEISNESQNQKQSQNDLIQTTLQQIMQKLTKLDERINRLEHSTKGAIPKKPNGK